MDERLLAQRIIDLVRREPGIVAALAAAGIGPRYAYWRLGDALRDLRLEGARLAHLAAALSGIAPAA